MLRCESYTMGWLNACGGFIYTPIRHTLALSAYVSILRYRSSSKQSLHMHASMPRLANTREGLKVYPVSMMLIHRKYLTRTMRANTDENHTITRSVCSANASTVIVLSSARVRFTLPYHASASLSTAAFFILTEYHRILPRVSTDENNQYILAWRFYSRF